jgi:hypothetical protein
LNEYAEERAKWAEAKKVHAETVARLKRERDVARAEAAQLREVLEDRGCEPDCDTTLNTSDNMSGCNCRTGAALSRSRADTKWLNEKLAEADALSRQIAAALEKSKPLVAEALKLGRSIAGADPSLAGVRIGSTKPSWGEEACRHCGARPATEVTSFDSRVREFIGMVPCLPKRMHDFQPTAFHTSALDLAERLGFVKLPLTISLGAPFHVALAYDGGRKLDPRKYEVRAETIDFVNESAGEGYDAPYFATTMGRSLFVNIHMRGHMVE